MELLEEVRGAKESDSIATNKAIMRFLAITPIALRAVYLSAEAGNVRCIEAVREIEIELRKK